MAKYKADDLWDELVSEHTLTCTKCKVMDNIINCDDLEACDSFFEDGWRRTENNLYCPKCSKKYLKNV